MQDNPTPADLFAAAAPYVPIPAPPPPNFIRKPQRISAWGNVDYGFGGNAYPNCVTAEEAFAKACDNPEIFISDDYVIAWAKAHNTHIGAQPLGVMRLMRSDGFLQVENRYDDGVALWVDYKDSAALRSAIFEGPVKLGVDARQLETACRSSNPFNPAPQRGWFAVGFSDSGKTEEARHCVSLCGYGTLTYFAVQLGVQVPNEINGEQQGYAMFTWGSIGIIDEPSMRAIVLKIPGDDQKGEAWLRKPTTVKTLVTPVSLSASQMGSGGDPRIYYLATNNHVCELAWGAGSWKHRDVTTLRLACLTFPAARWLWR